MKAKVDACRCLTYRAVCLQDEGKPFETLSAELKLYMVPTIQEVTRMAVQIHGSYGYAREFDIEKQWRDQKVIGLWMGGKGLKTLENARYWYDLETL